MSIYRGRTRKEFYLAALLYDAIEDRDFISVKSLLSEKQADPNLVLPKKGIAPFHLVIGCDDYEFALKVVIIILQHGGNPNVSSDDGLTPLHIAAAWGRSEMVRLFLNSGADPEAKDANRLTPLHYAHEERHADCLQLLRDYYPVKSAAYIKEDDEKDTCEVVLDKIVIDNGTSIGEYKIVDRPDPGPNSIIKKEPDLHLLPQKASTTEYVMNWFDKHVEPVVNVFHQVPIPKSTGTSPSESVDSFESSADESNNEKTLPTDPEKVTFRKTYRKTRKVKNCKSCTPAKKSPPSPGLDKTVYFDVDRSENPDPENFTKLEQFSKESGVLTLPSERALSTVMDIISKESQPIAVAKQAEMPIDKQLSKESGIVILASEKEPSAAIDIIDKETRPIADVPNDKSSDYLTCSVYSMDKNVFDVTDDVSNVITPDNSKISESPSLLKIEEVHGSEDLSFVSVSEVYKYVDKDEGIVLFERRLVKSGSECGRSAKSCSASSVLSLLPETIDNDTLRKELTLLGFIPGPITDTTKRVYLKKLHHLKKYPSVLRQETGGAVKRAYSVELEKTLRNPNWSNDFSPYKTLEEIVSKQFSNPDPARKWREGNNKCSFTYLLLDPRVTDNLPCRAETMQPKEVWETFLSAVFYVGKGKRSRPYQHLYDAVNLWKRGQFASNSKKIQKILDIWRGDGGVICLHVFQNIIPAEAYTREASMITALKLDNLTNVRSGDFYGMAATWPQKDRKMLGVYLLYKAMVIFLNEGERQLCPADIE